MSAAFPPAAEPRAAWAQFERWLSAPGEVQARVLHDILAHNADCDYGRHLGFASISCARDYGERVPVIRYHDLAAAIDRMERGEPRVLTSDPVISWEETGGSSAGAKLVPYTAAGLAEFQSGLLPWLGALHAQIPATAAGRAYWAISPACRAPRATRGGIAIGLASDTTYFGETVAPRLLASLAVPPAVGRITDAALWRRITLLHLAACADLTLISVWSPTFLLDLLANLRAHAAEIAAGLATGSLGPDGRRAETADLPLPPPCPLRACVLLSALRATPLDWRALWPRLALISCWDHARAAPYAQRLRELFPGVTVQGKGLLATEGLVSIPVAEGRDPVLAFTSGYYEFVDDHGRAHGVEDIEVGKDYSVLLTNSSGLYRYAIGDRVRVSGRIARTPTLRFLGRSGVTSDLCGEKLDEAFVGQALATLALGFGLLIPQRDPLRYVLILDAAEVDAQRAEYAAETMDRALHANPQYAYARRIGQLAQVHPLRSDAPLAAWIDHGVRRGQRLGDIKLPALDPREDGMAIFRPVA